MDYLLRGIFIDNFKSYSSLQKISISDLSVFLGANSSGKSTSIQTLLALKQTMECNSQEIELLLSGRYVALGEFDDVIYDKTRDEFSIGIDFKCDKDNETTDIKDSYSIKWLFKKADDKFQAILSSVLISYEDKNVSFERNESNKYQMIVDGVCTPIFVIIRNLHLTNDFLLKYDKEFNKIFADFINEMKLVVEGKKHKKFSSNELVASRVVSDFYMNLLGDDFNTDEKQYGEDEQLAEMITDLIERYSFFQSPIGSDYLAIPKDVKKKCMLTILKNASSNKAFQSIFDKYKKLFDEYTLNYEAKDINYTGEEKMSNHIVRHIYSDKSGIVEAYCWVNSFYQAFERIIANLFFVGPIRETPKGLYSIGFEQVPKYVGPTGSNFASVLLHENIKKLYIMPYGEVEKMTLWDALNEWASHLNIASAVSVSHATSFGIKVSVYDTQNKIADIMNVGIGTSQVLPVLITGLLSEENETLVFEQPELHLHPFSQSRLADFFVALIKRGRKIIVETHSEAFILRLRYHILKENCDSESVSINFFQNKHGSKVSVCNISGYGNIDYPDDFRDETQELLNDIMSATLKKEYK